ncbi:hypothetical protein ACJZ2D_012647 [Fusarium nematophilum]
MDRSSQATSINPALQISNKRPFSRVISLSPQAIKKACLRQQDPEFLDNLTIHQPTPRSATFPTVAFLENLAASPLDKVGNWLQTTYPFIREVQSRSVDLLRPSTSEMAGCRNAQSAPTGMPPPPSRRRTGQAPTPVSSSRGPSARTDASPAPTSATNRPGTLALPPHISQLVSSVQTDRDSPLPSPTTVRNNSDLYAMEYEASEPQVEEFFRNHIAPRNARNDLINRSDRTSMKSSTLPSSKPQHRLSIPVPDMFYGYNRSYGFDPAQRAQISAGGNALVANNDGLLCPFFAIEFKASAACINVAERLNQQLRRCNRQEIRQLDSASFSIAMNSTEARLYVSWKQEKLIQMQKVDSFILQRPEEFLKFRTQVRNIID